MTYGEYSCTIWQPRTRGRSVEQNSGSSGLGHLRSDLQDGEWPDPARQDWKNHQIHSRRHRGVYQCASHRRLNENSPARAPIKPTRRKLNWACQTAAGSFCFMCFAINFWKLLGRKQSQSAATPISSICTCSSSVIASISRFIISSR